MRGLGVAVLACLWSAAAFADQPVVDRRPPAEAEDSTAPTDVEPVPPTAPPLALPREGYQVLLHHPVQIGLVDGESVMGKLELETEQRITVLTPMGEPRVIDKRDVASIRKLKRKKKRAKRHATRDTVDAAPDGAFLAGKEAGKAAADAAHSDASLPFGYYAAAASILGPVGIGAVILLGWLIEAEPAEPTTGSVVFRSGFSEGFTDEIRRDRLVAAVVGGLAGSIVLAVGTGIGFGLYAFVASGAAASFANNGQRP